MKSSIKALGQNNTALEEEITKLKEPTQSSDQEVVSVPEEGSYAYQDEELSEESQLCSRFGHTHSHCRGLPDPRSFRVPQATSRPCGSHSFQEGRLSLSNLH